VKYFVPWTNRDPVFHRFDPDCSVLISPAHLPSSWHAGDWHQMPKELFVDSGAYSLRSPIPPSCKFILERQLSLIRGWPPDRAVFLSHPDILIPKHVSFREQSRLIAGSLDRAKSYFSLLAAAKMNAIPVGVIHGFDEEVLLSSYDELSNIGYTHFALGSLSLRRASDHLSALPPMRWVGNYNIHPIHLFGVTLPLLKDMQRDAFDSFDSSAPVKLGYTGTVLYGPPLQRYVIAPSALQTFHDRAFSFRKTLPFPLPCECPVCSDSPGTLNSTREPGAKDHRIIHNYFQIKWAIQGHN
jgi:queuine/archaeosine tRNA-ribosyltransferase